jgi:hypothetical protein
MRLTTRLALVTLLLAAGRSPATAAPLPPSAVRAWQTGLLRADRLEHASLSFSLGLGVGLLSREPAAAAAGAFAFGLAKEVRDRRHGGFDPVDLAADALGAGLAAVATRALAP